MKAIIIGSGPAAAATALALAERTDVAITVLDIGSRLEPERRDALAQLQLLDASDWDEDVAAIIREQPVRSRVRGLPEKRAYGSDYPFRDVGQLQGITAASGVNRSVISGAYGGFSNVWGAQIMPFADRVFDDWPVSAADMAPHYRRILQEIPFAAEEDDLAEHFPLLATAVSLPQVSARTERVLSAYERHRRRVNGLGIRLGKARLAMDAARCPRLGLCMTGCPFGLIYSATHTFDRLRDGDRVRYHGDLMAIRLAEDAHGVTVVARDMGSGELHQFEGDRAFVACGAVGTTRLVVNSLRLFGTEITMGESQQFLLPMISRVASPDPRLEPQFTLNQFNSTVDLDGGARDLSQLHYYTYNPAFADALPGPLRTRIAGPVRWQLLRRLSVALGYLPSWHSPRVTLRGTDPEREDSLPGLELSATRPPRDRGAVLRSVLSRLVRAGPALDLHPILPAFKLSATGKSYHWGGSFAHDDTRARRTSTDRLGRPTAWQRIHLVDASVFPNVAATTFTLTVMANAHRITKEAMGLE